MNFLRMGDFVLKEDLHVELQQPRALPEQGPQRDIQWSIDPSLLSPEEQFINRTSTPTTPNESDTLSLARPCSRPLNQASQFQYSDPSTTRQPSPYIPPGWPWREDHYYQESMTPPKPPPFVTLSSLGQAPTSSALLSTPPNLLVQNQVTKQKGPGRPRKHLLPDPFAPKRNRGRPKGSRDRYKRLGRGEKTKIKTSGAYEEEVRNHKTVTKARH
ncbi:hypothetical protein TW65_07108 [Stemphylium lycopersici]|uniref:Uncharacterized protein n=1 Tax=Stemphylium lycopersici TaxID=183478 RepID=A0A364NFT9_STELY|nr:hypothetical protein TW65_07108 [Stemphylium lycopersici]RAR16159.1 hypothetical protein DDE83_000516 [Stemphylium lycopersici]